MLSKSENLDAYKVDEVKQKITEWFEKESIQNLHFLETEFKCKVLAIKKSASQCSINYVNATTGVAIRYEPLDNVVMVYLVKLLDGNLPEYSNENWLNLDSLIFSKSPSSKIEQVKYGLPFSNTREDFKIILSLYARAMKEYASDILRGDFSVYMKIK